MKKFFKIAIKIVLIILISLIIVSIFPILYTKTKAMFYIKNKYGFFPKISSVEHVTRPLLPTNRMKDYGWLCHFDKDGENYSIHVDENGFKDNYQYNEIVTLLSEEFYNTAGEYPYNCICYYGDSLEDSYNLLDKKITRKNCKNLLELVIFQCSDNVDLTLFTIDFFSKDLAVLKYNSKEESEMITFPNKMLSKSDSSICKLFANEYLMRVGGILKIQKVFSNAEDNIYYAGSSENLPTHIYKSTEQISKNLKDQDNRSMAVAKSQYYYYINENINPTGKLDIFIPIEELDSVSPNNFVLYTYMVNNDETKITLIGKSSNIANIDNKNYAVICIDDRSVLNASAMNKIAIFGSIAYII